MRLRVVAATLGLGLIGGGACSGGQPCNLDYSCGPGETCWTRDALSFECMPSGKLQEGATCTSFPGAAPCGDKLACVALGDPMSGQCDLWCDTDHPCASGPCRTILVANGVAVGFCEPASTGAASCNVQYDCPAGQTCWTPDGHSFACMPSGAGKAGASCSVIPGTATCADRLACIAATDPTKGQCDSWCDATHPCAKGSCRATADTNGVTLSLCQ
jgi:hypothetical protein